MPETTVTAPYPDCAVVDCGSPAPRTRIVGPPDARRVTRLCEFHDDETSATSRGHLRNEAVVDYLCFTDAVIDAHSGPRLFV